MSCRRIDQLDAPLRDLWRRRRTLTKAQWGELYGIVVRVLAIQRLDPLAALPGTAQEYIQDFFQDKVMQLGARDGEIAHTCALVVYFERYLVSCLRDPYVRRRDGANGGSDSEHGPPDLAESRSNREALSDFLRSEGTEQDLGQLLDLVTETLRGAGAGPGAANDAPIATTIDDYLGIDLSRVLRAARQFLAAEDEWAELNADSWWIRLYLREHFCPDDGGHLALSALARRYAVPSHHHKALKLGVTIPRGSDAALNAFRRSYRGRWLASLGISVDSEHRTEMALALKILCLVALNWKEPRGLR